MKDSTRKGETTVGTNMTCQIDQSGKIEDTAKDTVIAISNEKQYAVILSAKNKRRLQEVFRAIGAPRLFVEYVFSALLVLLLKRTRISRVVVDLEYPRSTKTIESLLKPHVETSIDWKLLGKDSKAHDVAYKVYKGKLSIGVKISVQEVWNVVSISGEFLQKKTGGRLKIGLSPTNRRSAPVYIQSIAKKYKKSRRKHYE